MKNVYFIMETPELNKPKYKTIDSKLQKKVGDNHNGGGGSQVGGTSNHPPQHMGMQNLGLSPIIELHGPLPHSR